MLDRIKDILILVLAIGLTVGLVIWPKACQECPPDGFVLVKGTFIDSLQRVANMPPDTIRDTIRIKGDPVIVSKPDPEPVYVDPADTSKKVYSDRLFNDYLDATVTLEVRGTLKKITWEYVPIRFATVTTINRPVPYPVRYEVPVKIPQRGLFMTLGIGKGFTIDKPVFSGELFYLTKKGGIVGAEAGYFNGSYFKVEFGTVIKFK